MRSRAVISLEHFLCSFISFSVMGMINFTTKLDTGTRQLVFFTTGLLLFTAIRVFLVDDVFDIAWRAALLGGVCSIGIYVYLASEPHHKVFGIYMCVMAIFHFSEFFTIAFVQPDQASTDSFMLNHSPQYVVAAVTSWIEFFTEASWFPGLKQHIYISYVGLTICVCGEILRKLSMVTAGRSFNHLVQSRKSKDHVLVTKGIYRFCRHPSYVGWFYWAIGTQIILINPVCIPAYAVVSWMFFNSRIYFEENTLLQFFGQHYAEYQNEVGTGIPFIKGYKI